MRVTGMLCSHLLVRPKDQNLGLQRNRRHLGIQHLIQGKFFVARNEEASKFFFFPEEAMF